ncbi:hypothetical protein T07_11149 [Trichinella nelsoni]|uniref:HAT C-terminal dimerisation domain-containing protein n=1 Tax=Trichinella nelsoni TaxID=6336 RepID=A0A0V0RGT1_9BILA|nr:hypothetical protein T07_11149 [Trichinella nelsoni]
MAEEIGRDAAKTLYGDLIPLPRDIFRQMNRSNIPNKNTLTDVPLYLDFDQYEKFIKKFHGHLLKIYRRLKLPISALDALALYPKSYYLNVSLPLQIFASATAERSYTALKRLENYFLTTMTDERLSELMRTFILTFPFI